MISKWRLGECALPGLWVNPFPWTHSWPASVWGALEWSHVVCVLAQHSAAGWCYPRGLGCGLGGFTVRILWGKTQKCSVSFHKLYMKSKPRKCQFLPRTSNIKRSIRKKFSIQARMSSEIHLVIIREGTPVGKYGDNPFFKSHLYFILKFFSGWFLLSTVFYWINIPSTWQPLVSMKTSLIVSGCLGHGIWDQKRDILTTSSGQNTLQWMA